MLFISSPLSSIIYLSASISVSINIDVLIIYLCVICLLSVSLYLRVPSYLAYSLTHLPAHPPFTIIPIYLCIYLSSVCLRFISTNHLLSACYLFISVSLSSIIYIYVTSVYCLSLRVYLSFSKLF